MNKKRIIVTEDDACLQEIYAIILGQAGYEVEIFSNGNDLVAKHFAPPDLFLLDKQTTGVDGLEVCRSIKAQTETKDIPVIIVSASVNIHELSKQAGADASIEKPFEIKQLLNTIADQLVAHPSL